MRSLSFLCALSIGKKGKGDLFFCPNFYESTKILLLFSLLQKKVNPNKIRLLEKQSKTVVFQDQNLKVDGN